MDILIANKSVILVLISLFISISFGQIPKQVESFYIQEQKSWKEFIVQSKTAKTQTDFDVTFYYLKVDISIDDNYLAGNLLCRFKSTINGLDEIKLNLHNTFTIDSIKGNYQNHSFSNDTVTIMLSSTLQVTETAEITIYYSGIPELVENTKGLVYQTHHGNQPIIASLCTPFLAHYWWPCKDGPGDKPDSVYIDITIPDTTINDIPLKAISNGILDDVLLNDGKKTWQWRHRYPIVPYYVMVAISNYTYFKQEYNVPGQLNFPMDYYVFNENLYNAQVGVQRMPQAMELLSDLFGAYPFAEEKYGMTEIGFYGFIENQTNSIMYGITQDWESISVHELAHQWFGDMITCKNWHHGWLNEGFATYSEALWTEHLFGKQAYQDYMQSLAYYNPGTIYLDEDTDPFRIFLSIIYNKGAWVLHMLREIMGDSLFFKSLNIYSGDNNLRYGHAKTEDFQKICEEVSAMDLGKYFQQWIYGEYYPVYSYGHKVEETEGGYDVTLFIDQKQENTGLFWMPIDVRIYTANDSVDFVVWDSLESQQISFFVEDKPVNVVLDPDGWILKETRNKLIEPALDSGTLLINGLSWTRNGVLDAYQNYAFWGSAPITFWDISGEPNGGYPETLPAAEGQGELLTKKLGKYSTIIWLSSNTATDRENWYRLPIIDYLQAGGNIIFIGQSASAFFITELIDYLGITWDERDNLLVQDMTSTYPGLTNVDLFENMSFMSLFDTLLTDQNSTLLFKTTQGFDKAKGVGVWSHPEAGGDFVYLAARPWMMDHEQLKQNMIYMLDNFMNEPVVSLDKEKETLPYKFEISNIYPNPFNPSTRIDFSLPEQGEVTIKVYDVLGKQVVELIKDKDYKAGKHTIQWTANKMASGLYFIQLEANKEVITKKAILMK